MLLNKLRQLPRDSPSRSRVSEHEVAPRDLPPRPGPRFPDREESETSLCEWGLSLSSANT